MRRTIFALALTLLVGASALAPIALAQDEPDPMAERAETFEAAEGAQTENVPGGTLMVVAYGAIFALLLGYVTSLAFRQAKLNAELGRLREDLLEHARKNPTGEHPPEEF